MSLYRTPGSPVTSAAAWMNAVADRLLTAARRAGSRSLLLAMPWAVIASDCDPGRHCSPSGAPAHAAEHR